VSLRAGNSKIVFCEQKTPGTLDIWGEPFTCRRVPKLFNLRMDPYERADITSNTYWDWVLRRAYLVAGSQAIVAQFIATFKEFPPRLRPSSFSVDQDHGADAGIAGRLAVNGFWPTAGKEAGRELPPIAPAHRWPSVWLKGAS
jgi:hypothetical protein